MTILGSVLNYIEGPSKGFTPSFYIYDNNYVFPDTVSANISNNIIFAFNSLLELSYKETVNVPSQLLELGQFTSDSIQIQPFILSLKCTFTPIPTSLTDTNETLRMQVFNVVSLIKTYTRGIDLLTVSMQNAPLFDIYTNLKLCEFGYVLNQQQTAFDAELKFQQIRSANVSYGSLPINQVSNPQYSSSQSYGQQIAVTPDQKEIAGFLNEPSK